MASSRADISRVFKKIRELTTEAVRPVNIRDTGLAAADIVRRRTRLGYGATQYGGERNRLLPLSAGYIRFRGTTGARYLSEFTTPGRSNLTFTGQLLDSLTVIRIQNGKVIIGATGTRTGKYGGGKTNEQIARYVAKAGRPFLFLTKPEISQVVRFYRTVFGDLARRKGLT